MGKNWNGSGLSTLKKFGFCAARSSRVFPVTCFVFPYAKELECTTASFPTSLPKQVIEEVIRSFQTIGVRLVRVLKLVKVLAVHSLPCFCTFRDFLCKRKACSSV